jgi:chromosome segregation ATPase
MKKAAPLMLAVMMFCSLGLWGCSSQKNGAYNAKIRELEARFAKLEEDYRVVVAGSEQFKKKLGVSEAQRYDLEKQRAELAAEVEGLRGAVAERDEMKRQLAVRTLERDSFQSQLATFRGDLQTLLGRVDAAMNRAGPTITVVPVSRKTE